MRIVLDLQGAQGESRFRGIGRFTLSLATAIARRPREHEIWLLLNARLPNGVRYVRETFGGLIPEQRIRLFDTPVPVSGKESQNRPRAHVAEILREDFIRSLLPDAVLTFSLFEGFGDDAVASIGRLGPKRGWIEAVVLHDLIPLVDPDRYLPTDTHRTHYDEKLASLKRADVLLANSNASRVEAVSMLGIEESRIAVIGAGVSDVFLTNSARRLSQQDLLLRFGISRRFVMTAPGGLDPRKNIERLIHAYSRLSKSTRDLHCLVIVGRLSDHDRARVCGWMRQAGLSSAEVVLPGYVTDDDLAALYSSADLFITPSLHEGFGFPVVEALACGAPVIGSSLTSLPELIGREDALFDPEDTESITRSMNRALNDPGWMASLRSDARDRALRFSWARVADRTLDAIESAKAPAAASEFPSVLDVLTQQMSAQPIGGAGLVCLADCLAFNALHVRPPQLLLDISELHRTDARTGIQRVVRSLLSELAMNPPVSYTLTPIYFDGAVWREAATYFAKNFGDKSKRLTDEPVDIQQDDVYLSADLLAHMLDPMQHRYHELIRRGVKLNFVLYDLLLAHYPQWWPAGTGDVFVRWLTFIASYADGIACISRSVADEFRHWIERNSAQIEDRPRPPQISWFHLGADIASSQPTKGVPSDAGNVFQAMEERQSLLMVGTLEPRKGYGLTLSAFEILWAKGVSVNLVIVGKKGWLVDALVHRLESHAELGRRLFLLTNVSDEYLERIYGSASALLAASEAEGFGLPLIEAAQHGLPILARDIPVFREVAGVHAEYFPTQADPAQLSWTIAQWLERNAAGTHVPSKGLAWLTWRESAAQLMRALRLGVPEHPSGSANDAKKING